MHWTKCVLATVALCACGDAAQITPPRAGAKSSVGTPSSYAIDTLATLGGKVSRGNSINDKDWVAGYANLPDNQSRHAMLWRDGAALDLGTLGGANSNVAWPGQNNRGTVVGIAETDQLDPLVEGWSCASFFPTTTNHVCRGFVWDGSTMHALSTFGGTNGFATAVNARDQVVGWAENTVHDPTCNGTQVLQFRAALWDANTRAIHELRPLAGDSTSAATAINGRGQVVGISGACDVAVGEFSAQHMVLWENGQPRDIGSLGGTSWNTPMAINDAGEVVGFSDLPGDDGGNFNAHAFFWSRAGGVKDLGTLSPGETSQALDINGSGDIVGESCGDAGCQATLWRNGQIYNLNSLIATAATDSLVSAQSISADGTITGRVYEKAIKRTVPFVARPVQAIP